jgi:hypothetical protein
MERALRLADAQLWQFREQLLAALRSEALDHVRLARAVQAFVEEAGKEASQRRDRLRLVVGFAVEFYRGLLRSQSPDDVERIVHALDVSLAALEHLDRNVNQATLIAWWLGELARPAVGAT